LEIAMDGIQYKAAFQFPNTSLSFFISRNFIGSFKQKWCLQEFMTSSEQGLAIFKKLRSRILASGPSM